MTCAVLRLTLAERRAYLVRRLGEGIFHWTVLKGIEDDDIK